MSKSEQLLLTAAVVLALIMMGATPLHSQNTTPCLFNPGAPNPWPYPAAANGGYIPLGNMGQEAQFSISLWVKPEPVQNAQSILLDASHAGGTNWVIQSINGGATWGFLGCEFALQPNAWQHLLCTYNNGVVKVFINGVLDDQAAFLIAWGNPPNVYLGNWPEGGRRFSGYVDDLLITRNVLYDNDFNPPETFSNAQIPANSLGMWHCDEGNGATTLNYVSNQNDNLNGWQWANRPISAPSTTNPNPNPSSVMLAADVLELGSQATARLSVGSGTATVKFPNQSGTLVIEGTTIPGPVGSVLLDASTTNRSGYLVVNRQNISRTTYADLFNVIGTSHGPGDGATTFGLPDADVIPRDGLVGWWPFNGNANDESGVGTNGVINGATLTTDRFGYPNSAYYCDGNDEIAMPNYAQLVNPQGTVSVWFKTAFIGKQGLLYITSAGNFNEHVAICWYKNADKLEGDVKFNSGCQPGVGWEKAFSTLSYQDDRWHHALLTWGDGNVNLYVDGSLVATEPTPANDADICANATLLLGIGLGKIDDVALYNRIVTASERSRLQAAESPRLRTLIKH